MTLLKWNYEKEDYDIYVTPEDWECKAYCEDMDEIVNCAQCGKQLRFGHTYTSIEIQTSMGFGYGVCEDCHLDEWERQNLARIAKAKKILDRKKEDKK